MTTKEGLRRVYDLLEGAHQGVYGFPPEELQRERTVDTLEQALNKSRAAQAQARTDEVGRELIAEALARATQNKQGRLVDSALYEKATLWPGRKGVGDLLSSLAEDQAGKHASP